MLSAIFVDRPRLAIVIAIVITMAGLLSLTRIPVSQFPDIVPPQVSVTTTYPGASAAVVEATVGQPLEAQVNGVDQMIYMKSNSGNDGSYGLTVTFATGTNPDIATVNVNNRVQAALSRLPSDVQHQGVVVAKRSSAILSFLQFYSEGAKQDTLFLSNYVTINVLDALLRTPGVTWISLQKGPAAEQLSAANGSVFVWDGCSRDRDLAETAALAATLDLIITTDTSIAHLAGALGKPVWMLLPHLADWRWMQDSESTPWYPTARLLRQPVPGDWSSVVNRAMRHLIAYPCTFEQPLFHPLHKRRVSARSAA